MPLEICRLPRLPTDSAEEPKFYLPALECAIRYDRSTGYFSAQALSAAAQGIEGLIRNNGKMRLMVGCTLDEPEVEAISKGESLKTTVEAHLLKSPLISSDSHILNALELLAWMVAKGYLDVKIAIPCNAQKIPVKTNAIFHEKAGIIEDKTGDRLAFNGSINETLFGWSHNWDSFHVFISWGSTLAHVDAEEDSFQRLWANKSTAALVMDVPTAVREELLNFLPQNDQLPKRLEVEEKFDVPNSDSTKTQPERFEQTIEASSILDPRKVIWSFIAKAPALENGGERVGEATCSIIPWPHQVRAFHRMYDNWPPKLLIADEVGLGKTIQAGLILRQAWLAGRTSRILILAPKAVLKQWQIELREKFNLNWPIYDGQKLSWYASPAMKDRAVKTVSRSDWYKEPFVIASSHLMRRRDRSKELLEDATPWDLIILDEAHHARRKGGGLGSSDDRPNQLLRLMHGLKNKTAGLMLLTATPMQVSPVEVWDLLNLLELPSEWHSESFLKFFEYAAHPMPGNLELAFMAQMFRSIESNYGEVSIEEAQKYVLNGSKIKAKKILRALRDKATIPLRQLESTERRSAIKLMKTQTPIKHLISRNTRELLRRYHKAGKISTRIADRQVEDRFVTMTEVERELYNSVEDYISTTYNNASPDKRTAIGFVMTIYRRRLASSFAALAKTLENRLCSVTQHFATPLADPMRLDEDILEDELSEIMDTEEALELEEQALATEEKEDIKSLLDRAISLPTDTKASVLLEIIDEIRAHGRIQVMIFTQYTDTLDFLRVEVSKKYGNKAVLCFSGRGGEVMDLAGTWRHVSREETKKIFKDGKAEIMLCTDAAAEGLNFQFCGALINYDMPWNPMKVEQRIGRIDRLGQEFEMIKIVNLHYEDTVEADIYRTLRDRIQLFTSFVGKLQPILARLPRVISGLTLAKPEEKERSRADFFSDISNEIEALSEGGFDLDEVADEDITEQVRPDALYSLDDLHKVLTSESLLPPGIEASKIGTKDFSYIEPGMKASIRVTTDREYFENHPESTELWSPGNPAFPIFTTSNTESTKDLFDEILYS